MSDAADQTPAADRARAADQTPAADLAQSHGLRKAGDPGTRPPSHPAGVDLGDVTGPLDPSDAVPHGREDHDSPSLDDGLSTTPFGPQKPPDALLRGLERAWRADPASGGERPPERGERVRHGESRQRALARVIGEFISQHAPAGAELPPERELALALRTSRTTLRAALAQLTDRGQLERIPGLGTFIPRRPREPYMRLASFSDDMRRRGMRPSSRVLRFEPTHATGWLAREMGLSVGSPVMYLQRLLSADGEPMAVDENYLPVARLPGIERERAPQSLYSFLRDKYGIDIDWGEDQIDAITASLVQARLLRVREASALLQVVRHAYAGDDLINYSACFYRADRYSLAVPVASAPRSSRRP